MNGETCVYANGILIDAYVLPLKLLSFDAYKRDKEIVLRWATADEEDFSGFMLQHSTDAANWHDLAFY